MVIKRIIEVKGHTYGVELELLIIEESNSRLKEILIFMRTLFDGEKVEAATNKVGRPKTTGYDCSLTG